MFMKREGYENLRDTFRCMDDHDLLVESVISQKYQEDHLRTLNNSVAKNVKAIGDNQKAIAAIESRCMEREKATARVDKKFIVIIIVATSVAGTLGANSEIIARMLGLC